MQTLLFSVKLWEQTRKHKYFRAVQWNFRN